MDSIQPFRYDPADAAWVRSGAEAPARIPSTLTLATFNVWFGEHEFDARAGALLEILRRSDADVIGLQEVTLPFLRRLCGEDWVRRDFALSDAVGSTFTDYGTLLLSRLPVRAFEIHELPTTMNRTLLLGRLSLGSRELVAGCVHLESLLECAPYRAEQLQQIFGILEPDANAVVMGDFNFCSTWDENAQLDERYADLWPLANPDRPGWTVDTDANRMRQVLGKSKKSVRFDRILVRSERGFLKLRSIELLGTEPLSPKQPDLYPSDHFGLIATLDLRATS